MNIIDIINFTQTENEKLDNIKNCVVLFNSANEYISKIINNENLYENQIKACVNYSKIICSVDPTEYLLLDAKPRIPRKIYIDSFFNLGTLLKDITENSINNKVIELNKNNANRTSNLQLTLDNTEQTSFNKSLNCFLHILKVDFENENAIKQIISIYTKLTFFAQAQGDLNKSLNFLQQVLLISPTNPVTHYNLGFIYQRLNNLELAIIHYKLSVQLSFQLEQNLENKRLLINNFNGIASVYRSIKQWPESLHFLLKARDILPNDPDINNQLGVVYTEMRRTDLAEVCYQTAIDNYTKTFISTDPKFLLSEIYLNFGHCFSYNGSNEKSIECYNKSLQMCPQFSLPFQNKLMNLCYLFDQLEDKMYITEQHKIINKLYAPLKKDPKYKKYKWDKNWFSDKKINIGIISGDFTNHPVAFFISTYLNNFDSTRFNVTCYSECIIDVTKYNKDLKFKLIKGKGAHEIADIIFNDKIHILLDLAGHTAHNRLDVFSLKPSPISISYLGYPATSGLNEIDYRITDNICDGDFSVSQKFYTEKLITLKNCFLCYNYNDKNNMGEELPDITETPRLKNPKELIIGCFNRVNKITDTVITEFNKILIECPNVKMLFKTKALINLKVRKEFLDKFDKNVQDKIIINDCTLSHKSHVETYNLCDIAIDTFPYSGTTTSCEALSMGVAVLSLYDSEFFMHFQNVTCSILKNSDLDFYVCNSKEEIIKKIKILEDKPIEFWKTNKENVRSKFLNGSVCNKSEYMINIQELFSELYNKHIKLFN
jgi:predicted O-linked N-acetylglucosamine transferase (SPINDLY family)